MNNEEADYKNFDLPVARRVQDLVSRMELKEKVSQTLHASPAIQRLGIPEYNWWNECLHGVARAGVATVFPQAIGMAASWDSKLLHQVASAISTEARAKHHEAARHGDRSIYKGLTFWSPNINIFRDPRWGRGQETYGEDPFLTGRLGVAFITGLQGDDPVFLKLVATPKHFAVHSGPESERHRFDVRVSPKDMRETYLPAFKECVQEGRAASVMGAYNRTNGEPCSASRSLLVNILREEWGFDGYVVSDCGAIADIHKNHRVTKDGAESSALAVNNGCELNCGTIFAYLIEAVKRGLIEERTIDRAVSRLFTARFRLGLFDPPEANRYARIPYEVVDCEEHRRLNRKMAVESLVLLKNHEGLLPLRKDLEGIAVIGPNAYSWPALLGNYYGTPPRFVTPLDGIRKRVSAGTRVLYSRGCEVVPEPNVWADVSRRDFSEAVAAAERSDVVILCLGLTGDYEGEEGTAQKAEATGDRIKLELPQIQQDLMSHVSATGKPIVLVLFSGSALAVGWADEHIPAVLQAWYPGGEGGHALADVLFGDTNPSGRLPITFVRGADQLPPFSDYRMTGRTYRYMEEEPLYPFGFGLTYTTFSYGKLSLGAAQIAAGEEQRIEAEVKNTGERAGDEVVQLYLTDLESSFAVPKWSMKGFRRIRLEPGEKGTVSFALTPRQMALITDEGHCLLEPGSFRVAVGGCQPDRRSQDLGASPVCEAEFAVTGDPLEIAY
jgi:beta-glucosidase